MKNSYEVRGDVTAIFLNSRKYGKMETLISTSKLERAMEFVGAWYPAWNKNARSFYVLGNHRENGKSKIVTLHRWVTGAPKGLQVDHRNHRTLDNIDSNLLVVTHSENQQNRIGPNRGNRSGVRGVHWSNADKKWRAQIRVNGRTRFIGDFDNISDAEKAYKAEKEKHFPPNPKVG